MNVARLDEVVISGALAARVSSILPELEAAAVADDRDELLPIHGLQLLAQCGAMGAVLPPMSGGCALGWLRGTSSLLMELLVMLGSAHLSLGRLYEGHVNAFQLLWSFGCAAQRQEVCRYVADGKLLGVWNAPHASGPLALRDGRNGGYILDGQKAYASGAGYVERPLVTAEHAVLGRVVVWPRGGYVAGPMSDWEMHGMRASVTRGVRFVNVAVSPEEIFGRDDVYHKEPLFSTGAWRFLAVQVGAGERLGRLMASALVRARRQDDPHQKARMADVAIALATARLWADRARHAAHDGGLSPTEAIQTVAMARMAIERHLLEVMTLVQRSVGLGAFRRSDPLELVMRDLATYLRQPMPDLVREKIGEWAFAQPVGAIGSPAS
jgi:alkylation response protein AidB-like acyl-CoA dehydrogenase